MNKKKILILSVVLLFLICVIIALINLSKKDEQVDETIDNPKKVTTTAVKRSEVLVFGDNSFTKNGKDDFVEYKKSELNKKVPNNTKLILVPDGLKVEKTTLDKWINDKIIVLVYGESVKKEIINTFFGLEYKVDDIFIEGSFELKYQIIGFGYSEIDKNNIIHFKQSNSEEVLVYDDLMNYILENIY